MVALNSHMNVRCMDMHFLNVCMHSISMYMYVDYVHDKPMYINNTWHTFVHADMYKFAYMLHTITQNIIINNSHI